MNRKYFHHMFYYAVMLVFVCSCATKRKSSSSSPSSPPTEISALADLPGRPLIDPSTLKVPTVNMISQPICKQDTALVLNVTNPDSNADYFIYKLCPKGGKASDCTLAEFLDYSPVIHPGAGGDYTISVRTCIDPNHSQDPKMLCGAWSSEQAYTFAPPTAAAANLLKQQTALLNKMTATCQKIRDEMGAFLAAMDPKDPLADVVRQSLAYIGPNACRELLLSDYLNIADQIADIASPAPAPSSQQSQTQTQTDTQTAGQTIVYQTQQRQPQLLTGLVFVLLGSAGFVTGGVMAVRTFKNTVSKDSFEKGQALFAEQKKLKAVQVVNYNVEIADLYNLGRQLTTGGGDLAPIDRFDAQIDQALDKSLKDWGFPNGIDALLPDERAALEALKLNPNDRVAGAKLVAADKRLYDTFGYLDVRVAQWRLGADVPTFGDEFKSLLRQKTQLIKAHAAKADYEKRVADAAAKVPGAKPAVIDTTWLEAEIRQRMTARDKIQTDWAADMESYKKALAGGFKRGALQGGIAGAGLGALIGHFMNPIGFGGLQGVLAGGAAGGLLNGGVQGLMDVYEKYKELAPPFTDQQLREFASNKEFRKQQMEQLAAKEVKAREEFEASEKSPANYKAKLGAAAPWLAGAAISGIVAVVGARELALGDTTSPTDKFLKNYAALYKQGQSINNNYNNNFSKLLSGACN